MAVRTAYRPQIPHLARDSTVDGWNGDRVSAQYRESSAHRRRWTDSHRGPERQLNTTPTTTRRRLCAAQTVSQASGPIGNRARQLKPTRRAH